jgi:hypothetical protein
MFLVKLMASEPRDGGPESTTGTSLRESQTVHVRYEKDGRTVLQLGDAPGETFETTIGERPDCSYRVAYVMNEQGKTVETIR